MSCVPFPFMSFIYDSALLYQVVSRNITQISLTSSPLSPKTHLLSERPMCCQQTRLFIKNPEITFFTKQIFAGALEEQISVPALQRSPGPTSNLNPNKQLDRSNTMAWLCCRAQLDRTCFHTVKNVQRWDCRGCGHLRCERCEIVMNCVEEQGEHWCSWIGGLLGGWGRWVGQGEGRGWRTGFWWCIIGWQ